jgi:hypothetical protein
MLAINSPLGDARGNAIAQDALESCAGYATTARADADRFDRAASHERPRQTPRNVELAGEAWNT